MKWSRRPSTISPPMLKVLRLMAERFPDGVADTDPPAYTFAATTGLVRRRLARQQPAPPHDFVITEAGLALLAEIDETAALGIEGCDAQLDADGRTFTCSMVKGDGHGAEHKQLTRTGKVVRTWPRKEPTA